MEQKNSCKLLSICFASLFMTEDVETGPRYPLVSQAPTCFFDCVTARTILS